jgi:hypothetical protein
MAKTKNYRGYHSHKGKIIMSDLNVLVISYDKTPSCNTSSIDAPRIAPEALLQTKHRDPLKYRDPLLSNKHVVIFDFPSAQDGGTEKAGNCFAALQYIQNEGRPPVAAVFDLPPDGGIGEYIEEQKIPLVIGSFRLSTVYGRDGLTGVLRQLSFARPVVNSYDANGQTLLLNLSEECRHNFISMGDRKRVITQQEGKVIEFLGDGMLHGYDRILRETDIGSNQAPPRAQQGYLYAQICNLNAAAVKVLGQKAIVNAREIGCQWIGPQIEIRREQTTTGQAPPQRGQPPIAASFG